MKRFVLFVALVPTLTGCGWFSVPTSTSGALTRDDLKSGLDHLDQNFDKKFDEVKKDVADVKKDVADVDKKVNEQAKSFEEKFAAAAAMPMDEGDDGPTAEERRLRRKLVREEDARLRAETAQERAEDDADEERRKLRRERRRHIHAEERQEDRLDRLEQGGGRVFVQPRVRIDPTLRIEDGVPSWFPRR